MMNDDIEQRLGRLTPRGVRPELRPRVLAAVANELEVAPASPWLRRSALAVAASLFLGIAMNIWVNEASERRLAELFGPAFMSNQAMEVAESGGKNTDMPAAYARYCAAVIQLSDDLQSTAKDFHYETPEKDTQMDRDRPGRTGGDRSGCQRGVRLDHRYTA